MALTQEERMARFKQGVYRLEMMISELADISFSAKGVIVAVLTIDRDTLDQIQQLCVFLRGEATGLDLSEDEASRIIRSLGIDSQVVFYNR